MIVFFELTKIHFFFEVRRDFSCGKVGASENGEPRQKSMNNFKEWMIKSIFARQGHVASKAEVTQIDVDPQFYGGRLRTADVGYVGDVYVKLPLKSGFDNMDMATKRRIAAALVTPDNFRDLFAPDLTFNEWQWLPNHDLDTIMRYRWLKNNTKSITISKQYSFTMVYIDNERTDDYEFINSEWLKAVTKTTPDVMNVQFDDDPGSAWLHVHVSDVLKPTFDWKTIREKYRIEELARKEKAARTKLKTDELARKVAEEHAALVKKAYPDINTRIIDTGIVALEYREELKRSRDVNEDADEKDDAENNDESESKKMRDDSS